MAGYKEGVGGALRKCRHCNTDYETMQNNFEEEKFLPRTLGQHLRQCQVLDQSETLREHHSTNYGINRRSVLCDFPFFNVTRQMPQDIMHISFLKEHYHMSLDTCVNTQTICQALNQSESLQ